MQSNTLLPDILILELIVGKTHERLKTLEAELAEIKSLLSKQLNN